MTKEETAKIIKILKANYSSFKERSEDEIKIVIMTWQTVFKEEPFEQVFAAVMAYISNDTKGFEPKAGQIKEMIMKTTQRVEMTEQEAWGYVKRAISNGIYGFNEEFEKLPPIVQRMVGQPRQLRDWAMMDSDTVNSVVASNFMRSYRARAEYEREMLAIPQQVRQELGIDIIAERMRLKSGNDDE